MGPPEEFQFLYEATVKRIITEIIHYLVVIDIENWCLKKLKVNLHNIEVIHSFLEVVEV